MNRIALVFRSIGERTALKALDLAMEQISPDEVHLIQNIRPFRRAVRQALSLRFASDYVVFMDADCLVLEDLRPFLQQNSTAFVNCQGLDKFRGPAVAGVHIKRIDLVQAMQGIDPPENDLEYTLRPETKLRDLALAQIGESVTEEYFAIAHDFFQYYHDIFVKCAIRELRSRSPQKRARLDSIMRNWPGEDPDFVVAAHAVAYARARLRLNCTPLETQDFIQHLPEIAETQIRDLGLQEKSAFEAHELAQLHVLVQSGQLPTIRRRE